MQHIKNATDNIIEFELWGESALYTIPMTMVGNEEMTYPVPTYEALKGVCQSIYWKPTIEYNPLAVRIINPIRMEPRSKLLPKYYASGSDLAYHTYLKDVKYQVRVELCWSNDKNYIADRNPKKHIESARRWIGRGGKLPVFLGKKECVGFVAPCEFGTGKGTYDGVDMDLGIMFHGYTYPNQAYNAATQGKLTCRMFQCSMKNGIIAFPNPEECPIQRVVKTEEPKWIPKKY